jgi:chemotaxis protein MotB
MNDTLPGEQLLARQLALSESRRLWLRKAIKRHGEEEDVFIWSLADVMMLLLTFFIMLYASQLQQQASPPRRSRVAPSASELSGPAPAPATPAAPAAIATPAAATPAPTPAPEPALPAADDLQQAMTGLVTELAEAGLSVRGDRQRPVFVLGERITFYVGEADLIEDYLPALQRVAGFIADRPAYGVRVSGHTDNSPIQTARFPSNWELSLARAMNVARFLTANGVAPQRLAVEGYGEYRPVAANDTAAQRRANRRVEIALVPAATLE